MSRCSPFTGAKTAAPAAWPSIHYVTGTDTGAGKTVLAALLLSFLRARGVHALAMKPFCTGSREDVRILQRLQPGELTTEQCNPFFFRAPLAPAIAAAHVNRPVALATVLSRIRKLAGQCEVLIVEGAGGLYSPMGRTFGFIDIIEALGGTVWVAAPNRLGVLNHAIMTVTLLQLKHQGGIRVVLMNHAGRDLSSRWNGRQLKQRLKGVPVISVDALGVEAADPEVLKSAGKKLEKDLAPLLASDIFCVASTAEAARARRKKCH